ncbi:MAG: hypothetical protein HY347_09850 [candidate division NC10 bacterium]|nr:hypothetical protein [candidate division NC10 bacterium]
MTPEIGYGSLIIALACAVYGAVAGLLAARCRREELARSAQNAVVAHFLAVGAALVLLEVAFITSDFSIRFVAFNSASAYPLWYRIAGLWSALEGSILLWTFLQAGYTLLVVVSTRRRQPAWLPYVMAVLLSISAFFLLVMLIPANPFERVSPVPPEGRGMNPLVEAAFGVTNQEKPLGTLRPALRFYEREQTPIAEVDYRIGFREDLYVIFGRVERDGREIVIKALVNPMVTWIWLGGAVMAPGGLLALWPERRPLPNGSPPLKEG